MYALLFVFAMIASPHPQPNSGKPIIRIDGQSHAQVSAPSHSYKPIIR